MGIFNAVLGRLFDILLLPFRAADPWFGMVWISLLTAFLMLWVFKLTSNQPAIRKAKNAIKAHLLELRLFRDSMRISLRAQGGILKANVRYLAANTKPLLVMIVPLVLVLAQLNLRFGASPLRPGGQALVKVLVDRTADPSALDMDLQSTPGLTVETPPVRIPDEHEATWRVRAVSPGTSTLTLRVGTWAMTRSAVVGGPPTAGVPAVAFRGQLLRQILYPGEKPLPAGAPVREIRILYPEKRLGFFGLPVHWLVAYFILSIAFGFAFKGVFKVEI